MKVATFKDAQIIRQARAERRRAKREAAARIWSAKLAVRLIVVSGRCPDCGAGLRRNTSLAGWWQCEQFGADDFRKDRTKPACDWQGFTE